MKAVQTLWTNGRSLTDSEYWWANAEANVMSWALSCMSLREHFDEVVLYTDTEGARTLIDKLHLPYTEVVLNFDGFKCLTCHWALAKVTTYSLQTKPFLHIDGDIYLPKPLPEKVLRGNIIVQNEENVTQYYKDMITRLMSVDGIKMPKHMASALQGDNVPSFNLGFCGGNNLRFFGRFCDEVFRFFKDNDFNGERFKDCDISANVIFEQLFFAIMAKDEKQKVECVYPDKIKIDDNGYTREEFCDFRHYSRRQFLHVLGGHKRNASLCAMLADTLLREYPGKYMEVAALFPHMHKRLHLAPAIIMPQAQSTEADEYAAFIHRCNEAWKDIPPKALLAQAKAKALSVNFMNATKAGRAKCIIEKNPWLRIFWLDISKQELRDKISKRLKLQDTSAHFDIAAVPSVSSPDIAEIAVKPLAMNIISLAGNGITFSDMLKQLKPCFSENVRKDKAKVYSCVLFETLYLLETGIAHVRSNNNNNREQTL